MAMVLDRDQDMAMDVDVDVDGAMDVEMVMAGAGGVDIIVYSYIPGYGKREDEASADDGY